MTIEGGAEPAGLKCDRVMREGWSTGAEFRDRTNT